MILIQIKYITSVCKKRFPFAYFPDYSKRVFQPYFQEAMTNNVVPVDRFPLHRHHCALFLPIHLAWKIQRVILRPVHERKIDLKVTVILYLYINMKK